ncbi:MAG: PsbP-related protein [Bacteroidota bacterium]
MRRVSILVALAFAMLISFSSCGKKKPLRVTEWETYKDPYTNFSLIYPKGWYIASSEYGKVRIYSSPDAMTKFYDPASAGPLGVEIFFNAQKLQKPETLEEAAQAYRGELKDMATFAAEESTKLGNAPAVRIPYTIKIDSKNQIRGFRILAIQDTTLYALNCSAFNELYDDYSTVLDSIASTVRLPAPVVAGRDETAPSTSFDTYNSNYFDIGYPSNFEYSFPPKRGDVEFSVHFEGYRKDCTYQIDVSPAKGNSLDKVVTKYKADIAKKGYRIGGTGQTTISGLPAQYVNLSLPGYAVQSRAYFVVNNDKIYYIFMSWYQPKAALYIPVFERAVSTMKIK